MHVPQSMMCNHVGVQVLVILALLHAADKASRRFLISR